MGSGGDVGSGGAPGSGGAVGSGGTGSGGDAGAGGSGTGGTGTGGDSGVGGATHTEPWRIMALGDSITGTTCYPQLLSETLINAGRTNFELVGSVLNNQSCNGAPFVQSEGHGGYLVTNLVGSGANASELPVWCNDAQAEVVLMHFGTNDVWNNRPTSEILDAYSGAVDALRAAVPSVIVFVAQIIPMTPDNCSECNSRVQNLNAAIPDWASGYGTTQSPIYVIDQYTGFDTATDTADGVHPNVTGGQKMADRASEALESYGIP